MKLWRIVLLFGSISTASGITRDHVVRNDPNEHEVVLTSQDFANAENFVEIDLESIGISVPNDPTLTGNKFEGDILGFASPSVGKYANASMNIQRSAVGNPIRKWPNGEIPYTLSSRYGEYSRKVFAKVFKEYAEKSCVRFVPKTDAHQDYIYIMPDDGCYSLVGRLGGRQPVSLDEGCIQFGTIVHELMHTAGFFHEQSRTDRDEFVEIVWTNIDMDSRDQFEKYTTRTMNSLNLPYDYGSIMHYGPYAFTRNGKRTIRALKDGGSKMGQRDGFSAMDLKKLNKLYECKQTVPTDIVPTDEDQDNDDCEDKKVSCKRWAETGDCVNDRQYMLINCAKTCNFCDKKNVENRRTTTVRPSQSTVRLWPTEPPSGNMDCENKKRGCMLYARFGFCESDENYMRENCAKACGFCQPNPTPESHRRKPTASTITTTHPSTVECENQFEYSCGLWAKQGDCELRPDYMRQKCAKACGFCKTGNVRITTSSTLRPTVIPHGSCRDRFRRCRVWAQVGNCNIDREYMVKWCPQSCGLCTGTTGTNVDIDDSDTTDEVETTTTRSRRITSSTTRTNVNRGTTTPTTSSSRCVDDNPNCQRWSEAGFCKRNGFSEFVLKTCPKSCGTCRNRMQQPKLFDINNINRSKYL